jgi:hypothetical protein
MSRVMFQSQDGAAFQTGPFDPTVGRTVNRTHRERTFRSLYRTDGSLAGTEQRDALTLDVSPTVGRLRSAREIQAQSTTWGRWCASVRAFAMALFGCVSLLLGSILAYSMMWSISSSVGYSLAALLVFVCYFAYLGTNA